MLAMDDLITHILNRNGQVLIQVSDLRYNDLRLREIFYKVVAEYTKMKPRYITQNVSIPADGYHLPSNVREIMNIRINDNFAFQLWGKMRRDNTTLLSTDYELRHTENGKILYTGTGDYLLTYTTNYTVNNEMGWHEVFNIYPDLTSDISFTLNAHPIPNSIKLRTRQINPVTGQYFYLNIGEELEGDLGTGSVDYENLTVTLSLRDNFRWSVPLEVSYHTINPVIQEVSYDDTTFIDLAEVRYLNAFATVKSLLELEQLPFSINRDELLNFARQKLDEWSQKKETKQTWWGFAIGS